MSAEIERLAEEVHQVYCEQYEKKHGKPYWTGGDYSKLDEVTKDFDRAIVRWHLSRPLSKAAPAETGVGGGSELRQELGDGSGEPIKLKPTLTGAYQQGLAEGLAEGRRSTQEEFAKETSCEKLLPLDRDGLRSLYHELFTHAQIEGKLPPLEKVLDAICAKFGRPALEPLDEKEVVDAILNMQTVPAKDYGVIIDHRYRIAHSIVSKFGTRPATPHHLAVTEEAIQTILYSNITNRMGIWVLDCTIEELSQAILKAIGGTSAK
jgi:hypothetical protein